jgi:hypothetical protein
MEWTITDTQTHEAAFDDYVREILTAESPSLPSNDQKFGHVETHWHQHRAGVAFIASNPDTGTHSDRYWAEQFVLAQLEPHGFKRLTWTYDRDHRIHEATWDDIEAKARRLVQTGAVQLNRNGPQSILGVVQGDHGTYNSEIKRDDPDHPGAITGTHCECDWGHFQNLPRTRQWQRFQDRPCAHILATYWQAQATPLDEDRAPGDSGQQGQMSLPGMGDLGPMQAPSKMPLMQNSPYVSPSAWFNDPSGGLDQSQIGWPPGGGGGAPGGAPAPDPGSGGGAGMQAPSPEGALPQFPMDPGAMGQPPNPASTPGGNPGPTPTNPIQYPGGTFSKVAAMEQPYQNGDRVQLLNDDMGTLVGRSEAHGAGQQATVSKGSIGEVLGTDPVTNMVNVLHMGPQFANRGPMEPYGVQAWHWPSDLKPRPDVRAPGPNVPRSRPLA